jgi:CDP-glucose 4,6-dehydratase
LIFGGVYSGRRVLVTGDTGFKGSWLALWLHELGASVAGFAIDVPTVPSHFDAAALRAHVRHFDGDIRDRVRLAAVVDEFSPEIVFHLAAQALVRRSYAQPAETFEVNALGTLNVLEVLRERPAIRAAVLITSDKAYRNVEWPWGYRETDTLGGEDPYSGSKGCAELIAYSYVHSFFKPNSGLGRIATTRAGNVIGGGDWAPDRIVPDCMRAWATHESITVRNPRATRPWQHVLEPLSGYLGLGAQLWNREARVDGQSYNFGPDATVNEPVEALIREMAQYWPGAEWHVDPSAGKGRPEATLLKLSCDKALADLGWRAVLSFHDAVRFTSEWYLKFYNRERRDMFDVSREQIDEYCAAARTHGLPWIR